MAKVLFDDPSLAWMDGEKVRPYVFVRSQNRIQNPGKSKLDWFPFTPIIKNAQAMAEGAFTDQILNLENTVFGEKLAMPRWVFYDCAIMPGVTAGFAIHRSAAPASVLKVCKSPDDAEWIPLSLFVIIPTMQPGEWVAHNLSSINTALPEADRFYGLGFLSKAFGLWYANIETCCGMTQWRGPALRLHSHYGDLEIVTAFTPSHTVAQTLTYRLRVNSSEWDSFFTHKHAPRFRNDYRPAGFQVVRKDESSLVDLQTRLEKGSGPYFLSAEEILERDIDSELTVFSPSGKI